MVTAATGREKRRRICVFTGTRAEYGLLRPLLHRLESTESVDLRLLVSGSHLAPSHGETWREISADGFEIDERVEILLDADSDTAVCTAMGLGVMRYGEALQRIAPDCLVLLGDRYEALAAASAATVCRVPIAHLHGGELTNGAIDNAFRHAITKMSHLHFTSTETYRRRVIQMGEAEDRVFNVGALGVENAGNVPLLSRAEVATRLGVPEGAGFLLITFHPATLDAEPPLKQLEALLSALAQFPDLVCVFTGANADAGGRSINDRLSAAAKAEPNRIKIFASLGATLYLSAAKVARAVVGNSSSGIIEVPSLGVPVVDIGSRQAGRERAESVLWCDTEMHAIRTAIGRALSTEYADLATSVANPYDGGATSQHIAEVLSSWCLNGLISKTFVDAGAPADTTRLA